MTVSEETAHKLLSLALTKATINGEGKKYKLRIPHKELCASVGQSAKYSKVDLIVEFNLYWDDQITDKNEVSK